MKPEVSIIVPAYNEARLIGSGQASIAQHMQGLAYEVIVVDNGSSDATAAIAAGFPNVRVISIAKSTIGLARNRGAALASGTLFVFLDADVLITPIWVATLRTVLARVRSGEEFFGGFPYDIPPAASLIERAWFRASMVGNLSYVGSANLIVSASVFHRISGFNESLVTTEDMDFGQRAVATGQKITFDRSFHAVHLGFPRTLGHFVRREMWHGSGSFRSLASFIRSKVSVIAMGSACVLLLLLAAFATGRQELAFALLALYVALPLTYVIYRFRFRNFRYIPVQYVLGYLYLGSRAVCGLRSVFRLSAPWHRGS